MKIQIDTNEKMIAVEQNVNLDEFMKAVKKLFPNGEWKEYTIKTETTINWSNPIYIEIWQPMYPTYPYYPWVTYDTDTTKFSLVGDSVTYEGNNTNGIYCVEFN